MGLVLRLSAGTARQLRESQFLRMPRYDRLRDTGLR